jgi:flagellar basal body-associated protein FliL
MPITASDHAAGAHPGPNEPVVINVSCPYVGLRPYTVEERDLLYGRHAEAKRLIDKILSARLTLLYGPSGVGKTSLLQARVVPDLRNPEIGDTIVVVFDRWGESNVEAAIKSDIGEAIGPNAAGLETTEPLSKWVRLANEILGKPLVLILDQFEQFLLNRTGHPDPLRKELGTLVPATLDVHVVLSLREEYLAGLEVFSQEIVTVYDSKFRLEHLRGPDAREAIVAPAVLRGGTVEEDLVNALLADLQTYDAASFATEGAAPGIETPFLQIVCKELWEAAVGEPEKGHGQLAQEGGNTPAEMLIAKRLTLELYDRLGRHEKIIRCYIERLMQPFSVKQKGEVAEVLRLLAPPGGVKQPWDASHLSDQTHLPDGRVDEILRYLSASGVWVLRERLINGRPWYELYHDALIRILSPWLEEQLSEKKKQEWEQERRARRNKFLIKGGISISFIVLIGIALSALLSHHAALRRLKEADLADAISVTGELSKDAPESKAAQRRNLQYVFTKSAEATLNTLDDNSSEAILAKVREELKERFTRTTPYLLQAVSGVRPATREDYIYEAPCREGWANVTTVPSGSEEAMLSVDANLELDPVALQCAWGQMNWLVHQHSFPILLPNTITIRPGESNPGAVKLSFGDQEAGIIPIEEKSRHGAVVAEQDLPQWLHRMLQDDVIVKTQTLDMDRKKAWVLPRWTYPLLWAKKIKVQSEKYSS